MQGYCEDGTEWEGSVQALGALEHLKVLMGWEGAGGAGEERQQQGWGLGPDPGRERMCPTL